MRRSTPIWLLGAALACACERSGAASSQSAPSSPPAAQSLATSAAPAPGVMAAQIDRASIVAFVHRWAELQSTSDLLAHAALYAPGFAGSERLGELTTPYDLTGWLERRRRARAPGARVLVPGLEVLRSDGAVAVVIEPRRFAAALSDGAKTSLLLERAGDGWHIVREDLIQDEAGKRGRGPCTDLLEQLARAGASVRYFANLASASAPSPRWSAVSSHDDADGRSDDGHVWELWALLHASAGDVASVSRASPAGDWAREASFCFRSDGSPMEVIDRYRTLLPDGQLVDDIVTTRYSRQAEERSSKTLARYLASGKAAPADAYLRPPPLLVDNVAQLPFAALLAP
jgi:hypothetical protein